MKSLRAWFATPAGRQFFNIIYSLGASVVIIGALFKIVHIRGGDIIFIIGMSMEAAIFLLSAFDTSYTESSPTAGTGGGYLIAGGTGDARRTETAGAASGTAKATHPSTGGGGGGSSVIVVGGDGSSTGSGGTVGVVGGGGTGTGTVGVVGGGGTGTGTVGAGSITNVATEEYAQGASSAAQSLEDFSQTMKSLNETSQTILQAYKEIAETQNLGESMNTARYINDSLSRIKSLYDGAIGDSYMFKEEMSKMTRHIEALNQVYARLLQAMTMNNPNNNNNNNNNFQNPPY